MPVGERQWNPYRFVPVREEAVRRSYPKSQGALSGFMGSISCRLTTLTGLIVGQSKFIRKQGIPCIPGTSLKGVIRSFCELVGNGCSIVGNTDELHHTCSRQEKLCITCQMFGFVNRGQVYHGNVSISDAVMVSSPTHEKQWDKPTVLLSYPRETHYAFYGRSKKKRKVYHHQPGKDKQINISNKNTSMVKKIEVAPPETVFKFDVTFKNLTQEQLDLLLYAFVLEQDMAHKVGGARPLGAGSCKVNIDRIILNEGTARYRGTPDTILKEPQVSDYIQKRTQHWLEDKSETMEGLRVLMRFDKTCTKEFNYPSNNWFNQNSQVRLRDWKDFGKSEN